MNCPTCGMPSVSPVLRLPPRPRDVWRYVHDYQEREGLPPTLQEIADALGLKPPTVFEHLQTLVLAGAVTAGPPRTSRRWAVPA